MYLSEGVQQARDRRFNLFMYFSMVSNRHNSKHRNMVIKRFRGGGGGGGGDQKPFPPAGGFCGKKI